MASLELMATQYVWMCTKCMATFDALWRPTRKGWRPPDAYMWMADKPSFKFCPNCGTPLEGENSGTETGKL